MTFTTKDLERIGFKEEDIFGKPLYKSQKFILLCSLFAVLSFIFYWFQYRPSLIKQECYTQTFADQQDWVKQRGFGADDSLKGTYEACLASKGL